MDIFKSWIVEKCIAHRGLHDNKEIPENSLLSAKKTIEKGYVLESDVRILADGTPVIFHDDELSATTGKDGYITKLTKDQLKDHFLFGTKCTIPTLQELLQEVDGKTPIILDIKITKFPSNGREEQIIYDAIKNYKGAIAVQSYNPYTLEWFAKNAKEITRGLISSAFRKDEDLRPKSFIVRTVLKRLWFFKRAQPHFLVYNITNLPNRFVNKHRNIPLLGYTVKSQEQYLEQAGRVDNIIFEGFEPKI